MDINVKPENTKSTDSLCNQLVTGCRSDCSPGQRCSAACFAFYECTTAHPQQIIKSSKSESNKQNGRMCIEQRKTGSVDIGNQESSLFLPRGTSSPPLVEDSSKIVNATYLHTDFTDPFHSYEVSHTDCSSDETNAYVRLAGEYTLLSQLPESTAYFTEKRPRYIRQYSLHHHEVIGQGVFTRNSPVISARNRENNRTFAAKLLSNHESAKQELDILEKLQVDQHSNIANLVYFDEESQWLILEHGGKNLDMLFKDKDSEPEDTLIHQIMSQLIEALCYFSEKGIVHHDIKPENLLYQDGQLKICDFGLARTKGQDTHAISISYTPPERLKEALKKTARGNQQAEANTTDTWSAGCVLAELVTGERLFPHDFLMNSRKEIIATETALAHKIESVAFTIGQKLGIEAKDFFLGLMAPAKDRLTPLKAKAHPYISLHGLSQ